MKLVGAPLSASRDVTSLGTVPSPPPVPISGERCRSRPEGRQPARRAAFQRRLPPLLAGALGLLVAGCVSTGDRLRAIEMRVRCLQEEVYRLQREVDHHAGLGTVSAIEGSLVRDDIGPAAHLLTVGAGHKRIPAIGHGGTEWQTGADEVEAGKLIDSHLVWVEAEVPVPAEVVVEGRVE